MHVLDKDVVNLGKGGSFPSDTLPIYLEINTENAELLTEGIVSYS